MSEMAHLLAAMAAGILLGWVFFGGLWWTIRKAIGARQPVLWFFASMLVRVAVVLPGFYFVSASQWERLAACLAGFLMARGILLRIAGPPLGPGNPAREEGSHAP